MKNQTIKDERILSQKRKIGSDAFLLLYYSLLVSVLVQQYVFSAPFSQYAVEIICFLTSSVYILVRNLHVGNDVFSSSRSRKKLVIVNSIVCGLTVTVINTVLNYAKLGDLFMKDMVNTVMVSSITFLCATVTAFVVFGLLYYFNKRKHKQIETQLDSEDDENE